jgi:hypothetical protein
MVTPLGSLSARSLMVATLVCMAALPLLLPTPAQAWGRTNVFVGVRVGPGPFFAHRPFFVPRPFFAPRVFFVPRPFFAPRVFFGTSVFVGSPGFGTFAAPACPVWIPPFWNGWRWVPGHCGF